MSSALIPAIIGAVVAVGSGVAAHQDSNQQNENALTVQANQKKANDAALAKAAQQQQVDKANAIRDTQLAQVAQKANAQSGRSSTILGGSNGPTQLTGLGATTPNTGGGKTLLGG